MDANPEASRYKKCVPIPKLMKLDLTTCLALIRDAEEVHLPILHYEDSLGLDSVAVYTDYSGHLIASPSLGIYSPSMSGEAPLVLSLAYPRYFMLGVDDLGHKVFAKSTTLEALGFLVPLMMDPLRFCGREVMVVTDNAAAVIALRKGYSRGDTWATVVCRAARTVAAGICCSLQARWEPRRSSRPTRVSDDLTHNLLTELSSHEIEAYLSKAVVSFPEPVLQWMSAPTIDYTLGLNCLKWMRLNHPILCSF